MLNKTSFYHFKHRQTRYQRYILCHQLGLSLKLAVLCFAQFTSNRPPPLTLKEVPKVKSKFTKRFASHDFLKANLTFQTSRTDNEGVKAI